MQGTDARRLFVAISIILLTCFAVYFNALSNNFVYDDKYQVIENRWVKDIKHLPDFFFTDVWKFYGEGKSNYYRPLMHTSYMLTYFIFGLNPLGFHLVNILFHAGVSVLVFFIALKLFGGTLNSNLPPPQPPKRRNLELMAPSFLAAMLFAVHPIHTEAVTWIAGFPEVSFAFFCLLSLFLYIVSTEDGQPSKGINALSMASFFVALLCKETAVTLPIILIAYDYTVRKKAFDYLDFVKRYAPYFMLVCLYFVLRSFAIGGFAPLKRHSELSTYQFVINTFPLFVQYLEKLIFPVNLNVFHVFHPIASVFETKGIISIFITAFFGGLTFITFKKNRMACFSLLLIVIPVLPVLYIPALGENTFAERYLYLPSLGFVLVLSLLFSWTKVNMPKAFTGLTVFFIILIGLYGAGVMERNTVWRDGYTLFTDTVKKSPDDAMPRLDLGYALFEKGRIDGAIEQYQIALELNPNFAKAHNNLGDAFLQKGWTDRAIEEFQSALSLDPAPSETHYNLGLAFSKKGWTDRAIEQYQIALKLNPNNAGAHNNLGNIFSKKGWIDKAIEQYQIGLKLSPDDAALRYNIGSAFSRKGLLDKAIEQYQLALSINPNNAEAHYNLGKCFYGKGLMDRAIEQYQLALSIKPNVADIYYRLGQAYSEKGLMNEAVKYLEIAVKLNPANSEFRIYLADALKMMESNR